MRRPYPLTDDVAGPAAFTDVSEVRVRPQVVARSWFGWVALACIWLRNRWGAR